MATSPNYAWAEPDNSSLVKNGASDIRTLGDAIDTSLWNVGFGQAGKNKIINGDFGIWQRSTSVTVTADATYYAPDRFTSYYNGAGATTTWSRQTFTAGTAPVAGYEGTYFSRISATSGAASTEIGLNQNIEDVRVLAGQTVTLSFWAKGDSARTAKMMIFQNFGTGGSSLVTVTNTAFTISTSWARYSVSVAMPSISGKTIGTNSKVQATIAYTTGNASGSPVLDIWGIQLEAGSKATPFQTATGTIQGELAACQRYFASSWNAYDTASGGGVNAWIGLNVGTATTGSLYQTITFPVPMRTAASLTVYDVSGTPASGKVFKGANGKNAATSYITSRQAVVGTDDATSASYLLFGYTASAEL